MTTISRRCVQCGEFDPRHEWSSRELAKLSGAADERWICPSCGGSRYELEPTPEPDDQDPLRPVDPDEARRSIQAMHRFG